MTKVMSKIAAVQMVSRAQLAPNLECVRRLVGEAASQGAEMVVLPEYWGIMGMSDKDKVALREEFGAGPMQECMQSLAREHKIWLVGGTVPLVGPEPDKVWNSTLVYDPQGQVVARYDKIHLFGFTQGSEAYNESNTIMYGAQPISFDGPCGRVGLSICYDLRFPELFRSFGPCNLILVPAAFTHTTGQAHWEILLRARAIENQCYVLAAAQGGEHENGRRTWGQSILIDPWGEIVAQLAEGEGVVVGEIDLEKIATVRKNLPALQHRKL